MADCTLQAGGHLPLVQPPHTVPPSLRPVANPDSHPGRSGRRARPGLVNRPNAPHSHHGALGRQPPPRRTPHARSDDPVRQPAGPNMSSIRYNTDMSSLFLSVYLWQVVIEGDSDDGGCTAGGSRRARLQVSRRQGCDLGHPGGGERPGEWGHRRDEQLRGRDQPPKSSQTRAAPGSRKATAWPSLRSRSLRIGWRQTQRCRS
jgi:hypothetical protein